MLGTRILGWRHALYWLHPSRILEAFRRTIGGLRGRRWADANAISRTSHGRLQQVFGHRLTEAEARVRGLPVQVGGGGNIDILYEIVARNSDPAIDERATRRVVETGIAAGWSSLAILLALEPRDGRLYSTDLPYPFLRQSADWVGCAVPGDLRDSWHIFRGPDREVLPLALQEAGRIDVAHYDSDKSYAGAMWAYRKLWEALRDGGVLIADDVGDHLAFRDFAATVQVVPTVVRDGKKFQGLLVKPD